MELFFKVEDMRDLYKWDEGQEFLALCEFASGDFDECKKEDYETPEDFRICVEAHLASLNCFNYLSEDETARWTLY